MLLIGAGAVQFAAGIVLMFIGRGQGGEPAKFLKVRYVEVSYALLITSLIGFGFACVFGGLAETFAA